MNKSVINGLLGVGSIPDALFAALEAEGLVLWDEGMWLSLRYRKYRSPRVGATGHKGLAGFVALSERRLVAAAYWETIDLPLDKLTLDNVRYGQRGNSTFFVAVNAEDFYDDRKGHIEHRLYTPIAAHLVYELDKRLDRLTDADAATAPPPILETTFIPRRSFWAGLLVWGIFAALLSLGILVGSHSASQAHKLLALGGGLFAGSLGLYFWATTSYRVTPSELILESGCFRSGIALDAIRSITSRRATAGLSYAWTLDTLCVETGTGRRYLIAPRRRRAFLAALRSARTARGSQL